MLSVLNRVLADRVDNFGVDISRRDKISQFAELCRAQLVGKGCVKRRPRAEKSSMEIRVPISNN